MDVYTIDGGVIGFIRVTRNETIVEYAWELDPEYRDSYIFIDQKEGKLVSDANDPADANAIRACVREAILRAGGIPWGDPRNFVQRIVPHGGQIELPPCIPAERFEDVLDYIRSAD